MLDRKVTYDITAEGISVGRRKKGATHEIRLSGTGIADNHAKLVMLEDGNCTIQALEEKAKEHTKINGKSVTVLDPVPLTPNDRICIGPSAIFLYKNKKCEDDTCHPDPEDDPITFDFASDEVYVAENADEEAKKAAAAAEMEEAHKKAMAEMEAKFKAEAEANASLLAEKEAAAAALADQAAAAEGDAGK